MINLPSHLSFSQQSARVSDQHWSAKKTIILAIAALGVVYGDIGTSPLYTIRECFYGKHAITLNLDNIYGVMSLVFWSLTIVISIKYVIFILLADNQGEGGIFALLGLISRGRSKISPRLRSVGHFGRQAIRFSWSLIVYPALLCNYFGQGALLFTSPEMAVNPFYGLVPIYLLYPMVALATEATVIASQALISGVFSLTQQATEMNFCPRFLILHTSPEIRGQIFIPAVNYGLMVACLGVVIWFRESSALAGSYGIAVTGTMTITSILFYLLIRRAWGWPLWICLPLVSAFLIFDLSFFGANLLKVIDGGWFTLLTAVILTMTMTTWRRGRAEVMHKIGSRLSLQLFLEDVKKHSIYRVPGIAVFMTHTPERTPPVLLHHLKHNKVLHEKVILLSILPSDVPKVPAAERVQIEDLGRGFFRVTAYNGFMQKPDVPEILKLAAKSGLPFNEAETTYYLGRARVFTKGKSRISYWRKALFAFMMKNAATPADYFGLPANRVVELGAQINI